MRFFPKTVSGEKMVEALAVAIMDARWCDCKVKDRPVLALSPKDGECKDSRHGRILLEFRTACCGAILVGLKGCGSCLPSDKVAERMCRIAGNTLAAWIDLDKDTIQN